MKFADRLKQTTVALTTTTITLGAAPAGYRTLAKAIADGDMAIGDSGIFFVIEDDLGNFVEAYFTITSSTVLTRDSLYRTSAPNNADVTFPAGVKSVRNSVPAEYLKGVGFADLPAGMAAAGPHIVPALQGDGQVHGLTLTAIAAFVKSTIDGTTQQTDSTVPTAPTNLASSSVTQTSFAVSFTAGTDNVAVLRHEWSLDGTSWTAIASGTSFNVTGRTAATTYTVRVRAVDTSGNASTAATLNVITAAASGGADTQAPTWLAGSLSTSSVTSSGYTMAWPSATDNVGVTAIESSIDGGTTWTTHANNITSRTVTGRPASTTDQLRVRAKDAAGNISNVLTATVTTAAANGGGTPGVAPFTVTAATSFPATMGSGQTDYWWSVITPTGSATVVSVEGGLSTSNTVPPTSTTGQNTTPKGQWFGAVENYNGDWLQMSGTSSIPYNGVATNYYYWLKVTDSNGSVWWFVRSAPTNIGDGVGKTTIDVVGTYNQVQA